MRKIFAGLLGLCLLLSVTIYRPSSAQTSPCPEFRLGATFTPGETVYVDIAPQIKGTPQEQQIKIALDRWSYANTHYNSVGITFNYTVPLQSVPLTATVLHFANQAFTLPDGVGPDPFARARFDRVSVNPNGSLHEGTIYFNTIATNFGGDGGPFYDPNKLGYESVYIKESLHEIGHPMGLNHPKNQQPWQSVMNNSSDCPNDLCPDGTSNMPEDITPCDNQTVN